MLETPESVELRFSKRKWGNKYMSQAWASSGEQYLKSIVSYLKLCGHMYSEVAASLASLTDVTEFVLVTIAGFQTVKDWVRVCKLWH